MESIIIRMSDYIQIPVDNRMCQKGNSSVIPDTDRK